MTQAAILAALPPGKTFDEALRRSVNYAKHLWADSFAGDEDERVDDLRGYCTRLCGGNTEAGMALANETGWAL